MIDRFSSQLREFLDWALATILFSVFSSGDNRFKSSIAEMTILTIEAKTVSETT